MDKKEIIERLKNQKINADLGYTGESYERIRKNSVNYLLDLQKLEEMSNNQNIFLEELKLFCKKYKITENLNNVLENYSNADKYND